MERSGDYLYVVESEASKQLYIFRILSAPATAPANSTGALSETAVYRLEVPADKTPLDPVERIVGGLSTELVGNVVLGAPLKRVRIVGDKAFVISSPAYAFAAGPSDLTDADETQPPTLFEVDLRDRSNPTVVRSSRLPLEEANDLAVDEKHVAVSGRGSVLIYELARLDKPKSQIELPQPYGLSLRGGVLFVGCAEGLRIFDMQQPPVGIGSYACPPVGSVFVGQGRAYLCHPERGVGLEIVDVSKPSEPRKLGAISGNRDRVYEGLEQPVDVEVRGNLACVADYCFGLKVFDVSNPARPRYLGGHFRFSRWWKVVSFRVCTDEDYAFVGLRAAIEFVKLPTGK